MVNDLAVGVASRAVAEGVVASMAAVLERPAHLRLHPLAVEVALKLGGGDQHVEHEAADR